MRMSAVNHAFNLFERLNVDIKSAQILDVGGTRKVYLETDELKGDIRNRLRNLVLPLLEGDVQPRKKIIVTENPLLSQNPGLKFFDKGFNASAIDTASDVEADFLLRENIEPWANYFDVTVSFDTLEHVRDPFTFCTHLAEVTKPGGYIYLQTVFSWVYHPSPKDFFRFSPDGLRECFSKANAEIVECDWDLEGVSSFIFLKKK